MTADEYEQLPPEEKEHFAKCQECDRTRNGNCTEYNLVKLFGGPSKRIKLGNILVT
jgi:hypothetical protein